MYMLGECFLMTVWPSLLCSAVHCLYGCFIFCSLAAFCHANFTIKLNWIELNWISEGWRTDEAGSTCFRKRDYGGLRTLKQLFRHWIRQLLWWISRPQYRSRSLVCMNTSQSCFHADETPRRTDTNVLLSLCYLVEPAWLCQIGMMAAVCNVIRVLTFLRLIFCN